jgi:LysM repeat protein
MFRRHKMKEGLVKLFPVSRLGVLTILLILGLAIAACERPLQEEPEETPTESAPEGISPTVPADVITPPPPDSTDPNAPPIEGEPVEGEQPATDPGAGQTDPTGGEVAAEQVSYVVQAGDTMASISQQYNITVESLATANGLETTAVLEVNQTLIVPVGGGEVAQPPEPPPEQPAEPEQPAGEQVHVVSAGENLYRISLSYGCTTAQVAAHNGIANPDFLSIGQEIRIPDCSGG